MGWGKEVTLTQHQLNLSLNNCVKQNKLLYLSDKAGYVDLYLRNLQDNTEERITFDSQVEFEFILSEKANYIAYTKSSDFANIEKVKLFLKLTNGQPKFIDSGTICSLCISKDESKLAYLKNDKICIYDILTNNLTETEYSTWWHLSFLETDTLLYDSQGYICTLNLNTLTHATLTQGELPKASPDGQRIVYAYFGMGMPDRPIPGVYIMNADGSGQQLLFPFNQEVGWEIWFSRSVVDIFWNDTSDRLALLVEERTFNSITNEWSFSSYLLAIDIWGNQLYKRSNLLPFYLSFVGNDIYYSNFSNIFKLDINTGEIVHLTDNEYPAFNFYGKLSRDAQKIIYLAHPAYPASSTYGIFTEDFCGVFLTDINQQQQQLIVSGCIFLYEYGAQQIDISTNTLVYIDENLTNPQGVGIYKLNLEPLTKPQKIISAGEWWIASLSLSCDSQYVTYQRDWQICKADINGQNEEYLTNGKNPKFAPVYRADGYNIAYLTTEGNLALIKAKDNIVLTDYKALDFCWSQDAKKIAYFDDKNLYLADVSDINNISSTVVYSTSTYVYDVAFSKDASILYFLLSDGGVYSINADGTNLTKINTGYAIDLDAQDDYLLYTQIFAGKEKLRYTRLRSPSTRQSPIFREMATEVFRGSDVYLYKFKTPEVDTITVYTADGSLIGTYSTIQEGINACPNGGRVICADGVYKGEGNKNLSWKNKKITVCSENGPENCIIDCENHGRGFYFDNAFDCGTISGFTIKNGSATIGGGIACSNSSPTIINCILLENTASKNGGGIYCGNYSSPFIMKCTISGNNADRDGGGICCESNSSPIINTCTILKNITTFNGGGICCSMSYPVIINCTISENIADFYGGGVCCTFRSFSTITNCIISENTANSDGGGIYCDWGAFLITNSIISGNTANSDGGGVCCIFRSFSTITNCIISENTANSKGGGIYFESSSSSKITNNIIINNNNYGIHEDDLDSDPSVNYNCFYNNAPNTYYDEGAIKLNVIGINALPGNGNNISANPQFISATNLQLKPTSPCIDAGSNTAPAIPSTDKDGNPRIVDGNNDGVAIVDMGAYEYQGAPTVIKKEWTFMVYIDADNDLESDAIKDFLEMAEIGSDENINIIVQFDRHPNYDSSYGNWSTAKRFYITQGMTPEAENAIEDIGEVNMGHSKTLQDFINWAISNYPAKRYALIMWNHGQGWRKLLERLRTKSKNIISSYKWVCIDETNDEDILYTKELAQALSEITQPMNLIGFDACLMQMVEVAYEIRNYGTICVASEDVEPGGGWSYNLILEELKNNPNCSEQKLGEIIVEKYHAANEYNLTLSAIDLKQIENVKDKIDKLAISCINNASTEDWNIILSARENTQQFNYEPPMYANVDALHFAQNLFNNITNPSIKSAATDAVTTINSAIIKTAHQVSHPNAYGLAIYFPKTEDEISLDYNSKIIAFAAETSWDEFLIAYHKNTASLLGRIIGTISYTGTKTGTLAIGIFNNPEFSGMPIKATWTATPQFPQSYTFSVSPGTYYIGALLDADYNKDISIGDPVGIYGDLAAVYLIDEGRYKVIGKPIPIHVEAGSVTSGIDFELTHEVEPIVGTITKVGTPTEVLPAGTVTYTIIYRNTSFLSLTHAIVGDCLPYGVEFVASTPTYSYLAGADVYVWEIGTLTPYQCGTIILTTRVSSDISPCTSLKNYVGFVELWEGEELWLATSTFTVHVSTPTVAELEIKKLGPDKAALDDTIAYTIIYSNNGYIPAINTKIIDTLPSQVEFISAMPTPTTTNNNVLIWDIGTLNAGTLGSITISAKIISFVNEIINYASITTTTQELDYTNNKTSFTTYVIACDLDIDKIAYPTQVGIGEEVNFWIAFRNIGNATATNVSVFDELSKDISYSTSTCWTPQGNVISPASIATTTQGATLITYKFSAISPSLGFEYEMPYCINIVGTVKNNVKTGTILSNIASVASTVVDINLDNNKAKAEVLVGKSSDVIVYKWGPIEISPGSTMKYNISYWNQGNATATGVILEDILPQGVSFGTVTWMWPFTITLTINGQKITWDIGTLTPWSSGYIEFTALASNVSVGDTLINTASITAINDPLTANNISQFTTKVVPEKVDLVIWKHSPDVVPGREKTIWINYWNDGTADAKDVQIIDDLSNLLNSGYVTYKGCSPGGIFNDNTVKWYIGTVGANEWGSVWIKVEIDIKTPVGTKFTNKASITTASDDRDLSNNYSEDIEEVVAFVDPNEKQVHQGFGEEGWIRTNQDLSYVIHFENTGNTKTPTVIIEDVLSDKLDASTLVFSDYAPKRGSYTQIYDSKSNKIIWKFYEIYLGTGECGFVSFRIKPKSDLLTEDKIQNQAKIIFSDEPHGKYKSYLDTNFVKNTIDATLPEIRKFDINCKKDDKVEIEWQIIDRHAGIKQIVISQRLENSSVWATITATISPIAKIEYGIEKEKIYQFKCKAVDNVGNICELVKVIRAFSKTLKDLIVYPNPWIKEKHSDIPIKFGNLTDTTKIRIYDISGALVKELSLEPGKTEIEFLPNKFASGIYIYIAKDNMGNIKIGKFIVIK